MGLLILTMLTALNLVEVNAKDGLHPAKIFGKHFSTEGDEVEFVCSTFGFRTETDIVHVYLCKNGVGNRQQIQTKKFDSKFQINGVKREDSGNYSCVFSKSEYELTGVRGKGDSYISHQVSAVFLPGDIALTETSVKGGSDVEFTCTVSDTRRTDLSRNLSYTYLCKDGAAVHIKLWDRENHGATFTVRKVGVEDSGNYSCVVFVSKFLLAKEMELHGNNAVELQIHGADDLHPTEIYGKYFSTEGDEVEFVCNTFGFKTGNDVIHVYLCKDGVGIKQQIQRERFNTTFNIDSVKQEDSGNYTCLYSKSEYKLDGVRGEGHNHIFLQVSAGFLPGNIALKDTSVMEGSDVEFTCTVPDIRRTEINSSDFYYTYLCKDGVAVHIKLWDRENRGAIFTLPKASMKDSGNYSCVVFISKLLSNNMMKLNGNNAVELQVHESDISYPYSCLYMYAVVALLSVLLIFSVLLVLLSRRQLLKQEQSREASQSGENYTFHHVQGDSQRFYKEEKTEFVLQNCPDIHTKKEEDTELESLQTNKDVK